MPKILEVIRNANPDILGIQEAYLWQLDNQAIARQVATDLGMNYFIGESGANGAHVVLFTRFQIVKAENYPTYFSELNPRGALHAEVVTRSGQKIHVFVVHLKMGETDVSILLDMVNPYLDDNTVLMGDMNFVDPSGPASLLHKAGWLHPLREQQGIDQIWVSAALAGNVQPAPPVAGKLTAGASDHSPVVVRIE